MWHNVLFRVCVAFIGRFTARVCRHRGRQQNGAFSGRSFREIISVIRSMSVCVWPSRALVNQSIHSRRVGHAIGGAAERGAAYRHPAAACCLSVRHNTSHAPPAPRWHVLAANTDRLTRLYAPRTQTK